MKRLSSIFPDDPHLEDRLDIIIADAEVQALVDSLNDPGGVYKMKVKKAIDQSLNRLSPAFSPSDIVHSPDKLATLLNRNEPPIHLGRPGGAPAAIFNPALAVLQQNIEHLDRVDISRSESSDVERAAKYLLCAVTFYKDKSQRQKAIARLVDEVIGKKGGVALDWADNIQPDSCWWYNVLGLSGDALLQAAVDYSKIVAQEQVRSPLYSFQMNFKLQQQRLPFTQQYLNNLFFPEESMLHLSHHAIKGYRLLPVTTENRFYRHYPQPESIKHIR